LKRRLHLRRRLLKRRLRLLRGLRRLRPHVSARPRRFLPTKCRQASPRGAFPIQFAGAIPYGIYRRRSTGLRGCTPALRGLTISAIRILLFQGERFGFLPEN